MKYNRADIDSTLRAAQDSANKTNRIKYVYSTAYGYTIDNNPAYWQRYYAVYPGGKVCLMVGNY